MPVTGQDTTQHIDRQKRTDNYYQKLVLLESNVRHFASLGIDVYEPDLSEEGGGLVYQTFSASRASLLREANALGLPPQKQYSEAVSGVEDGWYEATVKYSNSETYTRSTYTLNVEVESNRVVKIDFGNGGSVHSGYNNSGYYYSGGNLNFQYDFNRNIIGATTRVTVQRGGAYLTYDVEI